MGGGDKGLLPLKGRRVIDFVLDRFTPQVSDIAINANGPPHRFLEFGHSIVPDVSDDFAGPLAGVLAGLKWATSQNADCIVTAAADTPFFPQNLVPELLQAARIQKKPIALAATQGPAKTWRHPTFGLWPVSLKDDLEEALHQGVRKVVAWTDGHGTAEAVFPTTQFDPFFNINTPQDLIQAESMA